MAHTARMRIGAIATIESMMMRCTQAQSLNPLPKPLVDSVLVVSAAVVDAVGGTGSLGACTVSVLIFHVRARSC